MSTAGLVLILAVLLLGGVIATAGDRLGSKVGKAKLSLFKLRPRQTATLVTILSGITISATTLGVLFAVSKQLRDGVFRLDKIQRDLRVAKADLDRATSQKQDIEKTLIQAKKEQVAVQTQLNTTRQDLEAVLNRLKEANRKQGLTSQALSETQTKLGSIAKNYDVVQSSLATVSQQAQGLKTEISQLQQQRQTLIQQRDSVKQQIAKRDQEIALRNQAINQRDRDIAKLDTAISTRDRVLSVREQQLQGLEQQRQQLVTEVDTLNQNFQISRRLFQELRRGNVALLRNQVLYKGVVSGLNDKSAATAVDQLLQAANTVAMQQVQPGTGKPIEQIIQITNNDVNRLIDQIRDGRPYVIRVLSAGNYLVGEKSVLVFADVISNQLVFRPGEQVATTIVDTGLLNDQEIVQRLEQLLAASQFRAQRQGVLAEDIEINVRDLTNFVEKLKSVKSQLDVKAITAEGTYTAGPLRLQLIASRDGQVLFRSNESGATPPPSPSPATPGQQALNEP